MGYLWVKGYLCWLSTTSWGDTQALGDFGLQDLVRSRGLQHFCDFESPISWLFRDGKNFFLGQKCCSVWQTDSGSPHPSQMKVKCRHCTFPQGRFFEWMSEWYWFCCCFKLMSLGMMMPSNRLILSPPSPALSLSQHQGISNELALCIRWPKCWIFRYF